MADVIVGYDGSDGARAALDTALETSSAFGDRVVIAFGYHVQKLGGEVQDYAKAVQERAEEVVSHGLPPGAGQGRPRGRGRRHRAPSRPRRWPSWPRSAARA